MILKNVSLTVADTKSEKWKRLCPPPTDTDLGPMGIKTTAVPSGPGHIQCVLTWVPDA